MSEKLKYKLVYATLKEFISGVDTYEFADYFEIFGSGVSLIEKDADKFTIIIESWGDYFLDWMWKTPTTVFHKDGSVSAVPIKVFTQKWFGWNDYKGKYPLPPKEENDKKDI